MKLNVLSRRAGLALPTLGRSVWAIAPNASEIESVYPALDAALERRAGYLLVLGAPSTIDFERLLARNERDVVLPLPYRWALKRFILVLRPKLVILLGPDGPWRRRWMGLLATQSVKAVPFDTLGLPKAEAIAALLPELADSRELRESARRPRRLARFVRSSIGRRAVDLFARRRLDSWDELRQTLGQPRTILCLGNGPSAEDPALPDVAPEALFRVNWRWRERGFLTSPQVVFIGDPQTPNRLSTPIFGFRSPEDANYVLWRQCLTFRPPRFQFFIFDQLPPPVSERLWAARPTNGAIMIATAVALRPERLVIAGVDLYRHPLGRYPGGTEALDGYNRVHDREVEIDFIRLALKGFVGELTILSPILSAAIACKADRVDSGHVSS